jgi:hypothetical protein
MVGERTISPADLDRILVTDDVAAAVAYVKAGAMRHLGGRIAARKANVLLGESTPKRG